MTSTTHIILTPGNSNLAQPFMSGMHSDDASGMCTIGVCMATVRIYAALQGASECHIAYSPWSHYNDTSMRT